MAPGLQLGEYQTSVLSEQMLNPEGSWMLSLLGEVTTTNQEA